MGLQERWINAIYRVATGSRRLRMILAPVAGLFFLSFVVLFVWLSYLLDGWLGLPRFRVPPYNLAASIPFFVAGLLLVQWCYVCFYKARGTPVPLDPPKELVAKGPYAVTRNPMLTGIFLVLLGIGILLGSICITLVFTPLFILLMALELKYIEEPELEKRLGQPYVEYRKQAPMFLPRFRGGRKSP